MKSCDFIPVVFASVFLINCASIARQTWDPVTATSDAERDIAAGNIRFCYVGGRVPVPPGIPDHASPGIGAYPRIAVGPQGCIQDEHSSIRWEYARRYNIRMWQYVSRMQRRSSNQSLQPTALWRCASMSILISLFSVGATPRSQSGG